MPRLAAVFMTAELNGLWSRIGIRLETSDHFHGYFPLDEALDVAQESAFVNADQ